MSASWEIRDRILIVTVICDWSSPGPAAAIAEALADPQFKSGTALLLDIRLCQTNPSSEEIRSRVEWMASLRRKGLSSRCAIVVRPRSYQFGLARMTATYLDFKGIVLEIFSELDEALHWLTASTGEATGQ